MSYLKVDIQLKSIKNGTSSLETSREHLEESFTERTSITHSKLQVIMSYDVPVVVPPNCSIT